MSTLLLSSTYLSVACLNCICQLAMIITAFTCSAPSTSKKVMMYALAGCIVCLIATVINAVIIAKRSGKGIFESIKKVNVEVVKTTSSTFLNKDEDDT